MTFRKLAAAAPRHHITAMNHPEPSAADFDEAARRVIARLPEEFREQLTGLVLRIDEFASPQQLASLELRDKWGLTGLYEGVPLTEQSSWGNADMPPVISLFRQPLLLEMRETGTAFDDLVRHVVIHEAGHHFGFSDDDMHALEDQVAD
ncbi:metallopeptidase family protein [Erythrobacter sp. MTPC3]|uniref:metallopeptidase family protein n=1 Tax=Erythrobacter sp. MTPC3 TaxID=3056564 RepID=UPI0036F32B53